MTTECHAEDTSVQRQTMIHESNLPIRVLQPLKDYIFVYGQRKEIGNAFGQRVPANAGREPAGAG
eukprot:4357196-Pyramimonas_sp.AAC.1